MYKTIKVMCNDCKQSTDESKVEFVNIEEDIQGRDILTFVCPYCNTTQKSFRI